MYCKLVSEFFKASQETPSSSPSFSPQEIQFLKKMVLDELLELEVASDLCEQVDALVDLIYYVCHASLKKGIDLDPFFAIVHKANMAKFSHGLIRRQDGKILKPPDWKDSKPLLVQELQKQLHDKKNPL